MSAHSGGRFKPEPRVTAETWSGEREHCPPAELTLSSALSKKRDPKSPPPGAEGESRYRGSRTVAQGPAEVVTELQIDPNEPWVYFDSNKSPKAFKAQRSDPVLGEMRLRRFNSGVRYVFLMER